MSRKEHGFTLIELLVVVIIISVLAAIAIPVFLAQRNKGYAAQLQSALKNASTAVESYAVGNGGSYAALNGATTDALLVDDGFRLPAWSDLFEITATSRKFCIEIRHSKVPMGQPWRRGTYFSDEGAPNAVNVCPAAAAL